MDFVLKDNPVEARVKIRECLLNAMERYTLETNKTHKVILHAKDRQIEFSGAMKELTSALGGDFVRCHRSFLVNKNNIKEVDAKKKNHLFHQRRNLSDVHTHDERTLKAELDAQKLDFQQIDGIFM